jgi:RNA polymerase sigma factor (TIGR02999 family)
MFAAPGSEVTRLLHSVRAGDRAALDRLLPLVYDELRRIARAELSRHHDPPTLQATGLVHDVYLKLVGSAGGIDAESRAHFLAIAARGMRQVLVDQARRRNAQKRGGGLAHATLGDGDQPVDVRADELLALDEALQQLDPRQRQIVECRYFGGMEETEIAAALGVSTRTVRRDWVKARAWLVRALVPRAGGTADG